MAKLNKIFGTVEETEAAFYDAISRADIEALMALWTEDDEIICIHPGAPRLLGHAAIRASWESIFQRGGVHIRPTQLHAVHNMMSATHNVIEVIKRAEHDQQDLHIVATNVYIKTAQGWRIVVHHASVATGAAPIEVNTTSMLH